MHHSLFPSYFPYTVLSLKYQVKTSVFKHGLVYQAS